MKHAAGRVVSPVLVGREAELERLVAAAVAAPSVAVVESEPVLGGDHGYRRRPARLDAPTMQWWKS
ncbi:hypothetical protein MTP10_19085 [Nonomuraea sp. 3-1Str]|uniref:hypothetical protein n=1 Tax=Nonomuraea sp. 3-1Str TaxID=2929801 RepID=UPI00285BD0B2|nr:hypothetical protein [Nonomuraea sp. 3-1Str]MDR8410830.1 hypothetical protein [Nonomuraea sp. 3-1Str]